MAVQKVNNTGFARKYRPKVLGDYLGNEVAKQSVMSLTTGVRPQVILVHGESGCGKTTLARLIAKEYLCESPTENGACDTCEMCQAVNRYISTGSTDDLDCVREIDTSAERSVGAMDELLQELTLHRGRRWSVYIFDECHKLTDAAQNRLLKIVEEPPQNTLMIFCTTNAEAMLPTLRNRCQRDIVIRKPGKDAVIQILRKACEAEGCKYDTRGLDLIARRSGLVPRLSLSKLESILAEKGVATYDTASASLGEVSDNDIYRFYHALLGGDVLGYVTTLQGIKEKYDLNDFVTSVKDYTVRGVYIINQVNDYDMTADELASYKKLFGTMKGSDIAVLLDRLSKLNRDDAEIGLIRLGYIGIGSDADVSKVKVVSVEAETAKLLENVTEAHKRAVQRSKVDADKAVTEVADMSSLEKMFGRTFATGFSTGENVG